MCADRQGVVAEVTAAGEKPGRRLVAKNGIIFRKCAGKTVHPSEGGPGWGLKGRRTKRETVGWALGHPTRI